MDGQRFDGLARRWATGATRREVFRILAGFALGGALTVTAAGAAGAKTCQELRKQCDNDEECCGTKMACRKIVKGFGPGRRCCFPKGGPCQQSADCCGSLHCTPNLNICA
jgi:hypothetical protein